MIVLYDVNLLDIKFAELGNSSDLLTYINITKGPTEDVFITADDASVVTTPSNYYVGVSGFSAPTGVNAKNVLVASYYSGTYALNEYPVITVQVNDSGGFPVAVSGIPITLFSKTGLLSSYALTTDITGAATANFYPTKQLSSVITSYSPNCLSGNVTVNLFPPTGGGFQQNWIQTDDIKPGAVDASKLAGDVNITPAPVSTLDAGLQGNINSIAVDTDYIYFNGYGAGGTTPTIRRALKSTFWCNTADAITYVNNNLAAGFDGMMHDGTDLWVAASGNLMQINTAPSGMSVTNDFVIDALGGSLQFIVDESPTELWTFLRGGASAYANKILRITKSTGAIAASCSLGGYGPLDRPQAAILGNYLYVCTPDGASYYQRVNRTTNAVQTSGIPNNNSSLACASDGVAFWIGGLSDVSWWGGTFITYGTTYSTMQFGAHPEEYNKVGICYRLFYDGVANVWGLCDGDPNRTGTLPVKYLAEFIRSFEYDGQSGNMVPSTRLGRFIDLSVTSSTIPVEPHSLVVSGDHVYTGNWQARNVLAGENISKYRFK